MTRWIVLGLLALGFFAVADAVLGAWIKSRTPRNRGGYYDHD